MAWHFFWGAKIDATKVLWIQIICRVFNRTREKKKTREKKMMATSPSTVKQSSSQNRMKIIWICGNYKIFCTAVPIRICVHIHTIAALMPSLNHYVFVAVSSHRLNTKKKFFSISKYLLYLVICRRT